MDEATTVATAMKSVTAACWVRTSNRIDALFVQHLLSNSVVEPTAANERQRFEAVARSVRDVLAQRWVRTEETYAKENPKRVYYLSMEFLIGRSLANNVTNLLLDPFVPAAVKQKNLDWPACSNRSRMPAWATADSAGSRRVFWIRWPRCSFRPWAMACVMNTAFSNSPSRTAGSRNIRTTGCAARTRGKSPVRTKQVKVILNCSFEMHEEACTPFPDSLPI